MHIAAVCCTFNRPRMIGRLIECFARQTIENAELVILDDLGQYPNSEFGVAPNKRVHLISLHQRFRTLGEKRNACAALANRDVDCYAVWDDDDFYYPWALSSVVEALGRGPFVQPHKAIDFDDDGFRVVRETFNRRRPGVFAYHGCWAYSRKLFTNVGGYPAMNCGEDQLFQRRVVQSGVRSVNIRSKPFYIYNRVFDGPRISELGDGDEPADIMAANAERVSTVPSWKDSTDWEIAVPSLELPRSF